MNEFEPITAREQAELEIIKLLISEYSRDALPIEFFIKSAKDITDSVFRGRSVNDAPHKP